MMILSYILMIIILVICAIKIYVMIINAHKELNRKELFKVNEERCESNEDEVE